jgi:hypothetical protein
MAATVPAATLRQMVKAVRSRLAAEIGDFSAWPEIAGVLHEAEQAPLAFVADEQTRAARIAAAKARTVPQEAA